MNEKHPERTEGRASRGGGKAREAVAAWFRALPCLLLAFCVSCASLPPAAGLSRRIAGEGRKGPETLTRFFMANNPGADRERIGRLARLYVEEAAAKGINSDVAFAQMCLETGFLRFGNLVTPEMNNFCGLGATDAAHRGESFATEGMGGRAHIQHLHAYALADRPLRNDRIDPRYHLVRLSRPAEDVFALAGTWAADPGYGRKIDRLLLRLARTKARPGPDRPAGGRGHGRPRGNGGRG